MNAGFHEFHFFVVYIVISQTHIGREDDVNFLSPLNIFLKAIINKTKQNSSLIAPHKSVGGDGESFTLENIGQCVHVK